MADLVERLIDPDMPAQELRLHMGEMTAQEMRTARAAIRWANTRLRAALEAEASEGERRGLERAAEKCQELATGWVRDYDNPNSFEASALLDAEEAIRALIPEALVRDAE